MAMAVDPQMLHCTAKVDRINAKSPKAGGFGGALSKAALQEMLANALPTEQELSDDVPLLDDVPELAPSVASSAADSGVREWRGSLGPVALTKDQLGALLPKKFDCARDAVEKFDCAKDHSSSNVSVAGSTASTEAPERRRWSTKPMFMWGSAHDQGTSPAQNSGLDALESGSEEDSSGESCLADVEDVQSASLLDGSLPCSSPGRVVKKRSSVPAILPTMLLAPLPCPGPGLEMVSARVCSNPPPEVSDHGESKFVEKRVEPASATSIRLLGSQVRASVSANVSELSSQGIFAQMVNLHPPSTVCVTTPPLAVEISQASSPSSIKGASSSMDAAPHFPFSRDNCNEFPFLAVSPYPGSQPATYEWDDGKPSIKEVHRTTPSTPVVLKPLPEHGTKMSINGVVPPASYPPGVQDEMSCVCQQCFDEFQSTERKFELQKELARIRAERQGVEIQLRTIGGVLKAARQAGDTKVRRGTRELLGMPVFQKQCLEEKAAESSAVDVISRERNEANDEESADLELRRLLLEIGQEEVALRAEKGQLAEVLQELHADTTAFEAYYGLVSPGLSGTDGPDFTSRNES